MKAEIVRECLSVCTRVDDIGAALEAGSDDELYMLVGIGRDGAVTVVPVRDTESLHVGKVALRIRACLPGNVFRAPSHLKNLIRGAFEGEAFRDVIGIPTPSTDEELIIGQLMSASYEVDTEPYTLLGLAMWSLVLRNSRWEIWKADGRPIPSGSVVLGTFVAPRPNVNRAINSLIGMRNLSMLRENEVERMLSDGMLAEVLERKYGLKFAEIKGATVEDRARKLMSEIEKSQKEQDPIVGFGFGSLFGADASNGPAIDCAFSNFDRR